MQEKVSVNDKDRSRRLFKIKRILKGKTVSIAKNLIKKENH